MSWNELMITLMSLIVFQSDAAPTHCPSNFSHMQHCMFQMGHAKFNTNLAKAEENAMCCTRVLNSHETRNFVENGNEPCDCLFELLNFV